MSGERKRGTLPFLSVDDIWTPGPRLHTNTALLDPFIIVLTICGSLVRRYNTVDQQVLSYNIRRC